MTNLLENALKYVPAGGHVRVRVENTREVSRVERGGRRPGIAAADREAALRPSCAWAMRPRRPPAAAWA